MSIFGLVYTNKDVVVTKTYVDQAVKHEHSLNVRAVHPPRQYPHHGILSSRLNQGKKVTLFSYLYLNPYKASSSYTYGLIIKEGPVLCETVGVILYSTSSS